VRDLTLEQGKSVRSPPSEGQGVAETMCDELTTTHSLSPCTARGGGGREMGLMLSPARREE